VSNRATRPVGLRAGWTAIAAIAGVQTGGSERAKADAAILLI